MRGRAFFSSIYGQVLVATIIGVAVGHYFPDTGTAMKPFGDAFIKLVRMIVGPIIFCTVVAGIAGAGGLKGLGRTGVVTLIYFEIVTTAALLIGLLVVNVIKPGAGMNVDPASLDTSGIAQYVTAGRSQTVTDTLLSIIPSSPVDAFARTDILQVLFFSVLFGVALSMLGEKGRPVTDAIDRVAQVLFRIVGMIMHVAPLGAFGAMAFTVGAYGLSALWNLVALIATFYLTSILFVLIVLGSIARLSGFSILRYIAYIKDELLIVLGTSSSETVLPQMIQKMENLGASRSVVGLVIPTGYSFNLDGTNIYMTLATLFLAQATNTHLTIWQELGILGIAMLTSKGASGVTGAGFITLAATLSIVPDIPIQSIAILVGIDKFMSECRALTNLIGNGVACVVISISEGELDRDALHETMAHPLEIGEALEPGGGG